MSESCLFCKILKNEITSKKAFENEKVYAFHDIHPQAKTHILFIHRNHTKDINEMSSDTQSIADIFQAIAQFTAESELALNGFRVVTNTGAHAGQTVFHTHFHLLGGGPLGQFGQRS